MTDDTSPIRIIKKYANRRLYDTHSSSHITLTDIRQLVLDETPFQVVDAKTRKDITRSVLLQVIQEAESNGDPILSSESLKSIIRFYGPFQNMLGSYLEKSIEAVMEMQEQVNAQSSQNWSNFMQTQIPVMQGLMSQYLEQSKQLYAKTQNMFGMMPGFHHGGQGAERKPDK